VTGALTASQTLRFAAAQAKQAPAQAQDIVAVESASFVSAALLTKQKSTPLLQLDDANSQHAKR
jgi:hypothetical protein